MNLNDNDEVCPKRETELLEAGYLEYYASVQEIIKFIKGMIKDREQYTYPDYKRFADTLVKLIGNLVDDYMTGSFTLWASDRSVHIRTSDRLTEICQRLEIETPQNQTVDQHLLDDLIKVLESSVGQKKL
ncbi:hypothetical protein KM620_gp118 [Hyposidra talaca nucleopolyhedrovirus]|uniref:Uncharacterized protein n=1 Tax=Hyposidra talaca nucleopolyhedrovirus TaxID=1070315 RepID=A0A2Z4HI69_9ABAC|nr:hypothetical protein KM620_gp118 [Hyposidra talaca nucleopolyhedrovirus]AWW14478.1 hypothetical protein HytaNPV_gp118 [Hyposidra talaca nucleopolyhedrovirus]